MDKIRLAVFISGRGSNLKSLLDRFADPALPVEIVLVVSDKRDAPGLAYAREHRIQTFTSPYTNTGRVEFARMVEPVLISMGVKLVALAGFMRILDADFVHRWHNRILNIHPSLLPFYPGLHPQRRALEAGELVTGCTVHFVVPEVDAGPIIAQAMVPVRRSDTEETLSSRILRTEHFLYPAVVLYVAERMIEKGYFDP